MKEPPRFCFTKKGFFPLKLPTVLSVENSLLAILENYDCTNNVASAKFLERLL
jgi:hypothetical protein